MKIVLSFTLLLWAATSWAQPQRGQFLLNAAGNGGFGKGAGQPKLNYRFTSHLGGYYFVTDRLAVGLQGELNRMVRHVSFNTSPPFSSSLEINTFRVGPAFRFYAPLGRKTAFFVQGAAGLLIRDAKTDPAPPFPSYIKNMNHDKGSYAYVSPGFAWYPSRRLSVEATIGEIGYQKMNFGNGATDKSIGLLDLNFKLGVSFLLSGNRKIRQPVLME